MMGAPVAPQHAWSSPVVPPPNHGSTRAPAAGPAVQQQLLEEVENGLLLHFSSTQTQLLSAYGFTHHIHPTSVVPKMDGLVQAGWRRVHDYFFPPGGSVNDRVNYLNLHYDKMDAVLTYAVRHLRCFMAKIDIKAFFRHIGTDPSD